MGVAPFKGVWFIFYGYPRCHTGFVFKSPDNPVGLLFFFRNGSYYLQQSADALIGGGGKQESRNRQQDTQKLQQNAEHHTYRQQYCEPFRFGNRNNSGYENTSCSRYRNGHTYSDSPYLRGDYAQNMGYDKFREALPCLL